MTFWQKLFRKRSLQSLNAQNRQEGVQKVVQKVMIYDSFDDLLLKVITELHRSFDITEKVHK